MIFSRLERLPKGTTIIEGGAGGADAIARQFAYRNQHESITVEADWKKYGRSAGPKRNEEIAFSYAPDLAIGFWDGKSPGTKHSIKVCMEYLIPFEIHFP